MRNVTIAACVLTLASSAAPLMAQEKSDLSMRLEAILGDFHDRYGFPGVTSAIVLPEGTAVTAATGLADLESGRIMTSETPMLAASIGKTFVAATVLSLESEGVLSRTDLLSARLGTRPWFDALPNADTITIAHLLHHTAGLPDHVHLPAFQEEWAWLATDEGDFDPERLVTFVAGQAPLFEAGTD
jgi:D-alanyl-D-alanine carboxypeptidase